ncbi:GNAT family N-acetyltransferase [Noviherbaspirillum autotrophicum]|uniref:GCN5 family acetyltransferase n=1 Tax=Noviherbaspirillum autotrophicum TaxID=709839 RepID=A0A0C2BTM2_9BURK|nr:GNAT family protein [Noviherbaspirillum autotrophicum]KIF83369.1 GCN5 family acetyltransferase [Noviherbaspirillum autotrophicum]
MAFVETVTLPGRHATLEPLAFCHEDDIKLAVADGELWKLWFTTVPRPEAVHAYIGQLLAQREQGQAFAFAVRDNASGKIVGGTRYLNIDAANRRLEIGGTWYAQRVQRTGINTECKLMLLAHAFETLGCIAVEFRTDWFNKRSQSAIERLGAKRDGVLRNHMIMPDGRVRDSVVYSIIRNEWPGVKTNLQHKLNSSG